MKFVITLEEMQLDAIIGILPFERQETQKICVSARFVIKDKILDYRLLRTFIQESFKQEFKLLEDAQKYFSKRIPKHFPQIKEFWIKITKLEIFEDCKVSVEIHRKRKNKWK